MIKIDDSLLDIFASPVVTKFEWDTKDIKPFEEVNYCVIDIETTKIDKSLTITNPRALQVKLVGVRCNRGTMILEANSMEEERKLLVKLDEVLNKNKFDVICTYNGMNFDLPALAGRYDAHGLPNPIQIAASERSFRPATILNAYLFTKFYEVDLDWGPHVDLLQAVLTYDVTAHCFSSYSLKTVPVELGLRADEDRVHQTMNEMDDAYRAGIGSPEWSQLVAYLKDDLLDTEKLYKFLFPAIWYQLAIFPYKSVQKVAVAGAASKWQLLIEAEYSRSYVKSLPEVEQDDYQGAYTFSRYGLSKNVLEVDVVSLYPSIILKYGLGPEQDYKGVMHGALARIFEIKNALDAKKEGGDPLSAIDTNMRNAMKLAMNSAYGALATQIPFGSPKQAAYVTAYGRAICKHMGEVSARLGGDVRLQDTDSVYFAAPSPAAADEIYQALCKEMPDGISVAKENICPYYFVPPKTLPSEYNKSYKFSSLNGRKLVAKLYGDGVVIPESLLDQKVTYEALCTFGPPIAFESTRKSYIKWFSPTKQKLKGKFAKRAASKLEASLFVDWINALDQLGPDGPSAHYKYLRREIASGLYPVSRLWNRRKISVAERKVVERGYGKAGEYANLYRGPDGELTITGPYSVEHYLQIIDEAWEAFMLT